MLQGVAVRRLQGPESMVSKPSILGSLLSNALIAQPDKKGISLNMLTQKVPLPHVKGFWL